MLSTLSGQNNYYQLNRNTSLQDYSVCVFSCVSQWRSYPLSPRRGIGSILSERGQNDESRIIEWEPDEKRLPVLEGVAEREEGVNTFSASLKQPPLTKPSQRYHAITLEIRCHPPKKTLYSDSLVQLSVYSCGASSINAFSCQIPVTLDVVMVGLCSDDWCYQSTVSVEVCDIFGVGGSCGGGCGKNQHLLPLLPHLLSSGTAYRYYWRSLP